MLWVINVALVAAWVMMKGMSSLSTDALTSNVGKNINFLDPYPVQRFYTQSTNPRQSYEELIRGIRDMLTDGGLNPVFRIPRLADRDSVQSNRRFLLVEIINSNQETITVALDTTRLYVVGYRRTNEFHYFPDTAQGVDTLFPDLPHTVLPFDSSYGALAGEAGNRADIALGIAPLEQAIIDLQEYRRPNLARAFTVIVQMLSEAIRFRYIENFIGNIIERGVSDPPSGTMLDLENEWGTLSRRIQESVDGTLDPPILLTNRVGDRSFISTVTGGLALNIGILFLCAIAPLLPTNSQEAVLIIPQISQNLSSVYLVKKGQLEIVAKTLENLLFALLVETVFVLINSNSNLVTAGCNGGAQQRWSFNRDYTITNLDTGIAMDAQNNVVSLSPVVPGESQQEWHAWFL